MRALLVGLRGHGRVELDPGEAIAERRALERTIGLEDQYAIEEETVEGRPRAG